MRPLNHFSILICGRSDRKYARDETLVTALKQLPFREVYDCRLVTDLWIKRNVKTLSKRKKRFLRYSNDFLSFINMFKIKNLLLSRKVNIVFVMKWNEIFLHRLSKWAQGPRIPIIYDLWVSRYLKAKRDQHDVDYWKNEEAGLSRLCDHLLAVTEPYKSFYVAQYGFHPDRISVVPLAVEDIWLNHPPSREKTTADEFIIAYWGTVIKHHGLESAFQAARHLQDKIPAKFRFYNTNRILSTHHGSSFSDNVQLLDWLKDKPSLIHAVDNADVCLGHLSPSHDGHMVLPNKAIEAMARGKVVLHYYSEMMHSLYASHPKGLGTVKFFRNGVQGLCEAILELFRSPAARIEIGNRARQKVREEHTISNVAMILEKTFQTMISPKPCR